MARLKNDIQGHFTIVPNHVLTSSHISLKAIGMYSKLLSLPDNWKFTEQGLACIVKDGRESVRSALQELEELNLLLRFQTRDNSGRASEMIYYISPMPMTEENKKEVQSRFEPIEVIPENIDINAFLPITENPTTDNTHNIIYNKYNTININKKILKKAGKVENQQLSDDFELIWKEYPKKEGKSKAFSYYKGFINGTKEYCGKKIKLTNRQMWLAVKEYADECEEQKRDMQYIKMGSTFFNSSIVEYVEKVERDGNI